MFKTNNNLNKSLIELREANCLLHQIPIGNVEITFPNFSTDPLFPRAMGCTKFVGDSKSSTTVEIANEEGRQERGQRGEIVVCG